MTIYFEILNQKDCYNNWKKNTKREERGIAKGVGVLLNMHP